MLDLQELKKCQDAISKAVNKGEEPKDELSTLTLFLNELCAEDGALLVSSGEGEEPKVAADVLKHVFEELAPSIIRKMCRETSKDDHYLEICGGVLEAFFNLMILELKRGHFSQDFLFACRQMFDFDCTLHKCNFQIPNETLQRLFTQGSRQAWREALQEGDKVDAQVIHYDKTGIRGGAGWSQAIIAKIDEDALYLEFPTELVEMDRMIDRWSVEIAPFQSKTKEAWEWKKNLKVDDEIDANDDSCKWVKSTIISIQEIEDRGRTILTAIVGMRVYRQNGQRQDERGCYDGWSDRFDERIPIYSPRICKLNTQSCKQVGEDDELDETLDDVLKPLEGHDRVWAVPRNRKCASKEYMRHIGIFCHKGGLDLILSIIADTETTDQPDGYNLCVMAILISLISLPSLIFHKSVITEYGPKLINAAKKGLLSAPDKALRDVRREHIEATIKAIELLSRRIVEAPVREKDIEILKLEVARLCLNSSFMERRIQGIRDLNNIIRHNRIYAGRFTGKFLAEWMQSNGIFEILFDHKKTHLQLIQRSDEILKLLLSEDMLSDGLLEQFWSLTKTDLRLEVYKIISDCSMSFRQQHLDFVFDQIKNHVPVEKLDQEEFNCLSELAKYSKVRDPGYSEKVADFFWGLVVACDSKNAELIDSCIQKYRELARPWQLEKKLEITIKLVESIKNEQIQSIPCIKLFKGLIKDQSDRTAYTPSYSNTGTYPSGGAQVAYGGGVNGVSALRNRNAGAAVQGQGSSDTQDANEDEENKQVELTLQIVLNVLIREHDLIGKLLMDLGNHCADTTQYVEELEEGVKGLALDRKKLHVKESAFSHHDEVEERLEFLKFIAQLTNDFCISKKELGVIYDLLVTKSCVSSDQQEFLTWCKSSCDSQSTTSTIMDLGEVGEFFTEKIACSELDVKSLAPEGLEFLQFYFISLNEKEGNLERAGEKIGSKMSYNGIGNTPAKWSYSYSLPTNNYNKKKEEEEQGATPKFTLKRLPSELKELEMVWTLVLNCERPDVAPKVINFLIKVHLSLAEDLKPSRLTVLQGLIHRCMSILKSEDGKDPRLAKRVIDILKNLVHETEVRGTGDVLPHGALQKGESLDPLTVINKATMRGGELLVQVHTNTTLWDLKKEIASVLDLAPRFVQISKGSGASSTELKEIDNGKTMKALGIKGTETLSAQKLTPDVHIPNASLVGSDGELTPAALRIFEGWYYMFCIDGQFTKMSAAHFIEGCCGDLPAPTDTRIAGLFQTYDKDGDGVIELEEFLCFYSSCSRTEKATTVRENLKAFDVRPDLKKWSEVEQEAAPAVGDMPRYFISQDQDTFDLLMGLLDGKDQKVAGEAWELVQMLATNPDFYKKILKLEFVQNEGDGSVDWAKFFDKKSSYRLLYTLQIVQAMLGEGKGGSERANVLNSSAFPSNRARFFEPSEMQHQIIEGESSAQPQLKRNISNSSDTQEELGRLRGEWASAFLSMGGFQYVLKEFMACSVQEGSGQNGSEPLELKYMAFMLHLLRTLTAAAFSASNPSAFKGAEQARRNSQSKNEENDSTTEQPSFKELQSLCEGKIGEEILNSIDYNLLQKKCLTIINETLSKQTVVFEDKLIIEYALSLWVGCILHKEELFENFVQSDGDVKADQFLLKGLLLCPYETVRLEFKSTCAALCSQVWKTQKIDALDFILNVLTSNFSLISKYNCKQYFGLLCELLDQYFNKIKLDQNTNQAIDLELLLSSVIEQIRSENQKALLARAEGQKSAQTPQELKESASLFQGLIQLAGQILDQSQLTPCHDLTSVQNEQQRGLLDEIFTRFLFPLVFQQETNKNSAVKSMQQVIETKKKRKQGGLDIEIKSAAYKLLNGLIRRDKNLMSYFLTNCLQPLMQFIQRTESWNYTPPSASGRNQDFVGLQNLGCICYLNSMLQQFFMIPEFRYNLLSVDDGKAQEIQEYKGQKVDDNMLHQLQKLMANLELSERTDFNPWEFCFSFKEFDGGPTNTAEQKDAQEFLNVVFDRIENALKGTSRDQLLQSVFRGKTCSQLVCSECGKCKNRIEDFYNLSLTVKDIKSVYDSLDSLVQGEIISDYECSGCKKKVDVSKRTLIAETPNVLIVHLQRIIFNFDTFQNDKLNSHFEFPQQLNLKPYSYYDVMGKEDRLKKPKENDTDEDKEASEGDTKKEDNKEDEEENPEPEAEECFEYKLAGVTVHSGSAHAGHYWAYINSKRGTEGPTDNADDQTWASTDNERWMEFNDSTVRDFQLSKLNEECFGGDSSSSGGFGISSLDGWGIGGGGYGKSGYMLFYERRQKKPIKLLDTSKQDDTNKEKPEGEAPEKVYKEVNFRDIVTPEDLPNRIFQQVLEENKKFGFENDIYSETFYEFILGIQRSVAAIEGDSEDLLALRSQAAQVGSKVSLEILAKAFHNSCIDDHVQVLVELMHRDSSASLAREFLSSWFEQDGCKYLFSLLLECPDARSRGNVASLLKYVLVVLKMQEKDFLYEAEDYDVVDDDGQTMTMQRHKALSARFVTQAIQLLNTQVAKNWQRFDQFHDLLYTFALADVKDVYPLLGNLTEMKYSEEKKPQKMDTSTEAARIGLEFFFKAKFIEKASDFMLGKKSPLCRTDESRHDLGGPYSHPELGNVIKLICSLITDDELLTKYPMTTIEKEMILHNDLLKTMLGSASAGKQFGRCLANMCKDNVKLSKKVSKVFLRSIEQAHIDSVGGYLKALKPFLQSNDSLKMLKLEWVFGIPEIVSKGCYGSASQKYGLEVIDRINEESIVYRSPILYGAIDDALIPQILKQRGRFDVQCISRLKELLSLMRKDEVIARFVYDLPSTTYQCARFTDWIRPYLQEQLADPQRSSIATNMYLRSKFKLLDKAALHLNAIQPLLDTFENEQISKLDKALAGSDSFSDLSKNWVGVDNSEVIKVYPPQLIVGKQVGDDVEIYKTDEDPLVTIQIFQLNCEYAYSAPTGKFNLQLPHVEARNVYQSQSYEAYKRSQYQSEREANEAEKKANADLAADNSEQQAMSAEDPLSNQNQQDRSLEEIQRQRAAAMDSLDAGNSSSNQQTNQHNEMPDFMAQTKAWEESKREGDVLLKIVATNKSTDKDLKVWFKLGLKSADDKDNQNFDLRTSQRKFYLARKNQRIVEHISKIDPTQPFFFKNIDDIKVDLDVVVRNAETTQDGPVLPYTGGKRVHYADITAGIGVSTQANDFDDEREDPDFDDSAYEHYQRSPHYAGYDGPEGQREADAMGLLLHQSGEDADGSREEQDNNSSTGAVADYMVEDGQGNVSMEQRARSDSWQNMENEGGHQVYGEDDCQYCGAEGEANSFACGSCGQYGGNN